MKALSLMLIMTSIVIFVTGIILYFFPKMPFFGKLPGNIAVKGKKFSFFAPVMTSIIISIILTLMINLVLYLLRKI